MISVLLLLLLLLVQPLCPDRMCIVGRWCSTPCTEAKETPDYVPSLVKFVICILFWFPGPMVFLFVPYVTPPPYPLPVSPPPLLLLLPPPGLMSACSYHRIPTRAHGALSVPSHRSRSDHVSMYCTDVFWLRQIYSYIVWNPASSLAAASEV